MNGSPPVTVREPHASERAWIERFLDQSWGSTTVVSRGQAHDASRLPALLAFQGEEVVGLATFHIAEGECELVTLDSLREGHGIGSALLAGVGEAASRHGCARLWLITTNDNLNALRFYQRRGMRLVAVHRGAVDEARQIKPSIPLIGEHGIAIHDELELELELDSRAPARARAERARG
jgi:GNAT superfamily N-acetyltransferase